MCQPVAATGIASVSPITESRREALTPFPAQEFLKMAMRHLRPSAGTAMEESHSRGSPVRVLWDLKGLPLLLRTDCSKLFNWLLPWSKWGDLISTNKRWCFCTEQRDIIFMNTVHHTARDRLIMDLLVTSMFEETKFLVETTIYFGLEQKSISDSILCLKELFSFF